jgi:hypothetical protein
MHEVCANMATGIQVARRAMGQNCDEFHPETVMQQAPKRRRGGAAHA